MSAAAREPADTRFRTYLVGVLCEEAAAQIMVLALGWQVFLVTRRPFDLGLVGLATFVPAVLFVIHSGIVADRFDRRAVVVVGRCAEALCALGFLGLAAAGMRIVGAYLAFVFLLGSVRALTKPAEKTFLPNIVSPQRFVNAQAAYVTGRELVTIGGPALGGALLAFSVPAAFAFAGGIALVSAVAFLALRLPPVVRRAEPQTWESALAGLAFIRSRPVILGAISLDLFAVLFGGATALLPVYADAILRVGPIGLGYLRSAPAVGAALVALVMARHAPRRRVGPLTFLTVVGFGLATIVFGASRLLWLSLLALVVLGAFDVVGGVIRNGLIQLNTPDAMRGRVIAVQSVFTTTSNQLGGFESGALAALIGTVPSVVAGGIASLAVAALWAGLFPSLRRADRLEQSPTEV